MAWRASRPPETRSITSRIANPRNSHLLEIGEGYENVRDTSGKREVDNGNGQFKRRNIDGRRGYIQRELANFDVGRHW